MYIHRERDTHVRMRKELVHDLHDSTTAATAQDPPRFFLGWQMSAGFGMDVIAAIAIPYSSKVSPVAGVRHGLRYALQCA